jgi:hypothetical protein
MPVWQVGGTIVVEIGYNNSFETIQSFEIVATTVMYPDDEAGETMTIRGVSDLVRPVRNNAARNFKSSDTFRSVIDFFANEYGWFTETSSVDGLDDPLPPDLMTKKQGVADIDYLKLISSSLRLGPPRINTSSLMLKSIAFPAPSVGQLLFTRGPSVLTQSFGNRRIHSLSMERDGGQSTSVIISGWDPTAGSFVQKEFEIDKFTGDPTVTFTGPVALKELEISGTDVRNSTLAIAVVEHRGQGKNERVDVISSGRYQTELSAEALASRFFELRERLGRWATSVTDGHAGIVPYTSFSLDGNLAAVDRGTWLPVWCEHMVDSNGWRTRSRIVRVVDEPPPLVAVS